jgi:hypothetical protein
MNTKVRPFVLAAAVTAVLTAVVLFCPGVRQGKAPIFGVSGGKWTPVIPFGMVGCCNTPARDGAMGWTFAEPAEIDAYASAGGNLAVFRTGPYSDQGNGWAMLQSPPGTESRLRRACKYANSKGVACLVEAGTDNWSMKQGNTEYQLYGDNCTVTHDAPLPRYQRWTREVVHQVGDLQVLWSLGNEGWLCQPSRAWYDGLIFQIRQAEKDFNYPAHPIGNVYQAGYVGDVRYDFVEVHGTPEEFCNQPDLDVPIIWTESSNEAPPESNERMLQAKTCADSSGGRKAALLWRGGIPDPQWDALFASLGGHAPVRGPRKDTSCLWNKYEQSYGGMQSSVVDDAAMKRMQVAVEQVIAGGYSWLITPDGNNLVSKGDASDDYQRIDYFSLLQAYLQTDCTIAGNPDAPNSFYEVDNIELQVTPDPCAQSGQYLAFHPIVFGNAPNWNQIKRGDQLRQYPAVFKGRTAWNVTSPCSDQPVPGQSCGSIGGNYCSQSDVCPTGATNLGDTYDCNPCCKTTEPLPTPTPTPQPTPTPAPTPTPTPGPTPPPDTRKCPLEATDVTHWRSILKPNAGTQQIVLTPVACGPKVVAALNACGTACCELSVERGNGHCERKLYGSRLWYPHGIRLKQVYPDNDAIMKVIKGESTTGTIDVCGAANADRQSCVSAPVRAAVPACDIVIPPPGVPGQGCVTPDRNQDRALPKRRPGFGVVPR